MKDASMSRFFEGGLHLYCEHILNKEVWERKRLGTERDL